jgi:hypothetical protein
MGGALEVQRQLFATQNGFIKDILMGPKYLTKSNDYL